MDTKFCRDCRAHRPVSDFSKNKRSRDGLAFYCRTHLAERAAKSREARRLQPRKHRLAPKGLDVPEGSKWCPDCGEVRAFEQFPKTRTTRSGHATYCLPCHNARGHASRAKAGGARSYHLTRRYGITAAEADVMLEVQGGVCAICRTAPAQHVDHDHATGAVRALLCFNCNGGLGQFRDDPEVLRAAADYVRFHTLSQRITAMFSAAGLGPVRAIRVERPPVGSP
ncbi:endonuclease VII domain-containing protein [Blastococcus sp. SYSU DS0753]